MTGGECTILTQEGHHSGFLVAKEPAVAEFRQPRTPSLLGSKKSASTHLTLLNCISLSLHPSSVLASANCKGDIPFQGQGILESYPWIFNVNSALASSQKLRAEIGEEYPRGHSSDKHSKQIARPWERHSWMHKGDAQRDLSGPSSQRAESSAHLRHPPKRFAQPELRSLRDA